MKKLAIFSKSGNPIDDCSSLYGIEKYFDILATNDLNLVRRFEPDSLIDREFDLGWDGHCRFYTGWTDRFKDIRINYLFVQHELQRQMLQSYIDRGTVIVKPRAVRLDIYKPKRTKKMHDVLFVGQDAKHKGGRLTKYLVLKNNISFKELAHDDVIDAASKSKIFAWGAESSEPENICTLTNRLTAEMVACGMPIVGFKQTFVGSKYIVSGVNAILVDNEKQYEEAIMYLLKDDSRRKMMAKASRKLAEKELDWNINQVEFFCNFFKDKMSFRKHD